MKKAASTDSPAPELTLRQIFGKLPVQKVWGVFVTIATAVTAVASAGFFLGHRAGENASQEKLSTMSAVFAKSEAERIVQTERAQQSAEKLKPFAESIAGLNAQLAERDRQISSLNERLGRTNTCGFLQQQITSLEQQIANVSAGKRIRAGSFVISGGEEEQRKRDLERKAQDDAEVALLQQRMLAYTQQLNSCTK